jgi:hypothetical protein
MVPYVIDFHEEFKLMKRKIPQKHISYVKLTYDDQESKINR